MVGFACAPNSVFIVPVPPSSLALLPVSLLCFVSLLGIVLVLVVLLPDVVVLTVGVLVVTVLVAELLLLPLVPACGSVFSTGSGRIHVPKNIYTYFCFNIITRIL